jgi:hypothetical protein
LDHRSLYKERRDSVFCWRCVFDLEFLHSHRQNVEIHIRCASEGVIWNSAWRKVAPIISIPRLIPAVDVAASVWSDLPPHPRSRSGARSSLSGVIIRAYRPPIDLTSLSAAIQRVASSAPGVNLSHTGNSGLQTLFDRDPAVDCHVPQPIHSQLIWIWPKPIHRQHIDTKHPEIHAHTSPTMINLSGPHALRALRDAIASSDLQSSRLLSFRASPRIFALNVVPVT